MTNLRVRTAVSPLRRRFAAFRRARCPRSIDLVAAERPEEPMHCLRPATLTATARGFVAAFPGDVLYAVKCNPEPAVLRALWAGGVRAFRLRLDQRGGAGAADVSPTPTIHFMHPVKARGAIREAWARHGVRDFALDSADELAKILHETAATGVSGRARPDRAPGAAEGRRGAGPVRKVRRRAGTPPLRCCAPRGRTPHGSACRSMSARSASIRWPGATRWRWPAR